MKSKINSYVQTWENRCYPEGIPDEVPIDIFDKVPSYKRICLSILNNDHGLKRLGFSPKKSKYYSMLKKIEIDARPKPIYEKNEQLKINYGKF